MIKQRGLAMMTLADSDDGSQIYVLGDGSEIEITMSALAGNESKVVVRSDEEEEVIHELLTA